MLASLIEHHEEIIAEAQRRLDEEGNRCDGRGGSPTRTIDEHKPLLETLRAAQAALAGDYPLWMHAKRGTVYHEVGEIMVQCDFSIQDDEVLKLYRDVDSGKWFGRRPDEFMDGRFLPVVKCDPADGTEFVHFEGVAVGIPKDATPEEQAAFDKLRDEKALTVTVFLQTDDWEKEWTFTPEQFTTFARSGRFEITAAETADPLLVGKWIASSIGGVHGRQQYVVIRRAPGG